MPLLGEEKKNSTAQFSLTNVYNVNRKSSLQELGSDKANSIFPSGLPLALLSYHPQKVSKSTLQSCHAVGKDTGSRGGGVES